jgi:hypothetical protein
MTNWNEIKRTGIFITKVLVVESRGALEKLFMFPVSKPHSRTTAVCDPLLYYQ